METVLKVRLAAKRDGKSVRAIARKYHLSRNTVRKYLCGAELEPRYRRAQESKPKLGPFVEALEQLLQEGSADRKLLLVMDNAAYHRANRIKDFLRRHAEELEAFWLPPYSPELNLIEYIWGYLKENVTNNYFFGELRRLVEATQQACEQLSCPADDILKVEFKTSKYFSEAAWKLLGQNWEF